jgi:hypothetical protein
MLSTPLTTITGSASSPTLTFAQDRTLEGKLCNVTVAKDKNGNEYVRLVVPEQRTLNGVKYEADAFVMAFGNQVVKAKSLKAGDKVSMIVNTRENKGCESTTVVAFAQ